ncbi:MAG TPA: gamma subclass chorismate mutase AroQ [Rariglobus sp.]
MRALLSLWICAGLLMWAGCQLRPSGETAAIGRLAAHMAERLALAQEVAWAKAQSGAPVMDAQRESAMLDGLLHQGVAAGLDAARVQRFFEAQTAASRELQATLLAARAANTEERPATPPLDLRRDIRPRLDAVGSALIETLKELPPRLSENRRTEVIGLLRKNTDLPAKVVALAASGL